MFLILSLLFSLKILAHDFPPPGSQDHFQNFSQMASVNVEGEDYSINHISNQSSILITAFHGGFIEPGTSELGREISQNKFDFYSFDALKPGQLDESTLTSSTLHITSTRFDEPTLMSIIPQKNFCLGLHGFGGYEGDFCVGGGNEKERKKIVELLSKDFPELASCELCCPPLNGVSARNPINRCQDKGVQVEMSARVRRKILSNKEFRENLAQTFRLFLDTIKEADQK